MDGRIPLIDFVTADRYTKQQRKVGQVMLKIIFGEVENSVYHPPTYFDNQYEDEWIADSLSVAMIKDVDRSDVIATI